MLNMYIMYIIIFLFFTKIKYTCLRYDEVEATWLDAKQLKTISRISVLVCEAERSAYVSIRRAVVSLATFAHVRNYTCFQLLNAPLHDPDIPLQLQVGPLHSVPGPVPLHTAATVAHLHIAQFLQLPLRIFATIPASSC